MTHIEMIIRRKKRRRKKDEKKDEKKKSVAFKSTSSSKGKAKQETSSEDENSSFDEMDNEKMDLFVKRYGKFMVKKGYHARRKKSSSKRKDEARRGFKCGSKDHLVAQCPYNSENEDDDKNGKKKDKKEKKDKMTFNKKKGGSYVVTWDSDDFSSDDDDDSDNDKTTKKKAFVSIAINKSESEDEPTKDELIDMLEDTKEYFDIKRRECKDLRKELKALKQAFDELNASHGG
jgi:hypothetical protein